MDNLFKLTLQGFLVMLKKDFDVKLMFDLAK